MITLSGYHCREIKRQHEKGLPDAEVSLDFGLTKSKVRFGGEGVLFPDGQRITLLTLGRMCGRETDCYYVEESQAYMIQCYTPESKKFLKLYATGPSTAPTVTVSGIRMHQTKDMNPMTDTYQKIAAVRIRGTILDTCTGLGYTAICAKSKGAERVITIEREPLMLEIARLNPWSKRLFEDASIEQRMGDAGEIVKTLADESIDAIIHDPPRLSLAGGLYSGTFYHELWRTLKKGGGLFHYVGNPGATHRNKTITTGVKKRLLAAGFAKVQEYSQAQGIRAMK
ncbi:MAG: RsmD family RNA methyltransferase [Candidatus Altiarchaeota archaeon]|nr:RsmD family RNA methyltransferase [Candidatus Altiarchaeota archaeon]